MATESCWRAASHPGITSLWAGIDGPLEKELGAPELGWWVCGSEVCVLSSCGLLMGGLTVPVGGSTSARRTLWPLRGDGPLVLYGGVGR